MCCREQGLGELEKREFGGHSGKESLDWALLGFFAEDGRMQISVVSVGLFHKAG